MWYAAILIGGFLGDCLSVIEFVCLRCLSNTIEQVVVLGALIGISLEYCVLYAIFDTAYIYERYD